MSGVSTCELKLRALHSAMLRSPNNARSSPAICLEAALNCFSHSLTISSPNWAGRIPKRRESERDRSTKMSCQEVLRGVESDFEGVYECIGRDRMTCVDCCCQVRQVPWADGGEDRLHFGGIYSLAWVLLKRVCESSLVEICINPKFADEGKTKRPTSLWLVGGGFKSLRDPAAEQIINKLRVVEAKERHVLAHLKPAKGNRPTLCRCAGFSWRKPMNTLTAISR
ncbi:hypothetical protein CVT26_000577 [Gymnopilus dilepis]|uniref:Uncharacterized protein n=1 Tax=Gymnopilus dilepis TaxID=231916 RepID=A0A409VHC8_9AGAR|nr:hypothetical protein CVT26_000577 [Gymnopilus dilepis]